MNEHDDARSRLLRPVIHLLAALIGVFIGTMLCAGILTFIAASVYAVRCLLG